MSLTNSGSVILIYISADAATVELHSVGTWQPFHAGSQRFRCILPSTQNLSRMQLEIACQRMPVVVSINVIQMGHGRLSVLGSGDYHRRCSVPIECNTYYHISRHQASFHLLSFCWAMSVAARSQRFSCIPLPR